MTDQQTYRMTLGYRGTGYSGWQSQPDGNAVQDVVERALRGLHRDRELRLNGCSRTDRGVHALGQVAAYRSAPSPFVPPAELLAALNRKLPGDIVVKELMPSEAPFRPKMDAKAKTYTYVIHTGAPNCFVSDLAVSCPDCVQMNEMARALRLMEGTHDFAAFTVEAERPADCTRTMYSAQLDQFGDYICLSFTGRSFLYRMVRRLAGALLEVGCGTRTSDWISELLEGRADSRALKTAPPHGLYLMQVYYDQVPAAFDLSACPFRLT